MIDPPDTDHNAQLVAIVHRILTALAASGHPYCVVGPSDTVDNLLRGDIDIVVPRATFRIIDTFIYDLCRVVGGTVVQRLKHELTACYYVLWFDNCSDRPLLIKLDICCDYLRGGRRFLTADEIIANSAYSYTVQGLNGLLRVPAPEMEFIYYLTKKIDKCTPLSPADTEHLRSVWLNDPRKSRAQLARFWSGDDSDRLAVSVASGDWEWVRGNLAHLRRSLQRAHRRVDPWIWVRDLVRKLGRIVRPGGFHVVLLGPDGSGKTTLLPYVMTYLAPAFRRTARFHLFPRLISSIAPYLPATNPHGRPRRGSVVSVGQLLYWHMRFTAGWTFSIFPRKVRSTLILFDRYYHDLLVDPARYRYGGPAWLAAFAAKFIPAPDLWLFLDAPPELLQQRKREVSANETTRQRQAYLSLCARVENSVVLDVAQPAEKVAHDAGRAILRAMAKRIRTRTRQSQ